MDAQSWTAVASAVIALAALVFSVVSFRRQQAVTEQQLAAAEQQQVAAERQLAAAERQREQTETLTKDSVKPFLFVRSQTYEDLKSIRLSNYGIGPAIIRSATFEKAGRDPTESIVNLFDSVRSAEQRWTRWEQFVTLPAKRPIPPQADIVLIKQSLEHLKRQGIEESKGLELLADWQREKTGIRVRIEYDDIFGRPMEPVNETLK